MKTRSQERVFFGNEPGGCMSVRFVWERKQYDAAAEGQKRNDLSVYL